MQLAAKILGIVGIITNILIYQQKTRKNLLTVKLITDVIWLTHYILLGAYSGAGITFVGIIRESVFMRRKPDESKGITSLIVFWCLGIASTLLTWESAYSLLPMVVTILCVFSFWLGKPPVTRKLSFITATCMIIYNLHCGSIPGVVNESFTITSSIYGTVKYDLPGKRKTEERNET